MSRTLLVLLGLALLTGLWWWGMRPRVYRDIPLDGLRRFVSSLLAQMGSGGFFIAERESGPGFLQLALRKADGNGYTVEFGLPETDWSVSHFDAVRTAIERLGLKAGIEAGTGPVSRFMCVPISGFQTHVTDRAMNLFDATARALEWDRQSTFNVRFGGSLDVARIRNQLASTRRGVA